MPRLVHSIKTGTTTEAMEVRFASLGSDGERRWRWNIKWWICIDRIRTTKANELKSKQLTTQQINSAINSCVGVGQTRAVLQSGRVSKRTIMLGIRCGMREASNKSWSTWMQSNNQRKTLIVVLPAPSAIGCRVKSGPAWENVRVFHGVIDLEWRIRVESHESPCTYVPVPVPAQAFVGTFRGAKINAG